MYLPKSNFVGTKCCLEMFYHKGWNIDCKKNIFKQKHGPSNLKKVHFNLIIISFWLFKDCWAKLICQTINILYKCNYLFTAIFYISSKGSYQRFLKFFLKTMKKTTFCCFVFLKRKTKWQVSGSSFWFENKIVNVIVK